MESATALALAKQTAISRQLDVTASNIANSSTPGFRKKDMSFAALMHEIREADPLAYPYDRTSYLDLSEGPLAGTGNPLDAAIVNNPQAFFVLQDGNRQALTRAGSFTVDAEGTLRSKNGRAVVGANDQPIVIDRNATTYSIADDGTVLVDNEPAGKLKVVAIPSGGDAEMLGDGMLFAGDKVQPTETYGIRTGVIEGSNVDAVKDMSDLITLSRSYELLQQAISLEDNRKLDMIEKLPQF